MQKAREVFESAQDQVIETWVAAQQVWSGTDPTTWERIGVGVVCVLVFSAFCWSLLRLCSTSSQHLAPVPPKEEKGMSPKAVTMGRKQKQLLVRVMESGFYELRKQDQDRIKNKVKGPKPISDAQAKALYRAVGYAFDIPCVLPVTTKARFKAQIRSGLKKLKAAVPLKIPGAKPKGTVEANNLPVIKEVKSTTKSALSF